MADIVERVRVFNRFWTEVLGLLDQGLLNTEHSLAEARLIFELAQRESWERRALRDRLGIDASFLTRVLGRLEAQGLVATSASATDGRQLCVALTDKGRQAYGMLNNRSVQQIEGLLSPLSAGQRQTLAEGLGMVMALLRSEARQRNVTFRDLQPGDMGWVIQRHGDTYADEYGWNMDFEGLVAQIVAEFHANFRPGRERAWIAEVDGVRAGCVFCCQHSADTAQLRILLVEAHARGLGIGRRLVDECIGFARAARYAKIMLWTNDVLASARRIYEAAGFKLVAEEQHDSFGKLLTGQTWELVLGPEIGRDSR